VPQPAITGIPPILQYGGQAQPGGAGTLSYINLNDAVNWFWMGWQGGADDDFPLHSVGRYLWRSKGVFLGQDAGSRKITFPMRYREVNNVVGKALAPLQSSGKQYLTFDNLTAVEVKYNGDRQRKIVVPFAPYWWSFDLEFLAPTPWFSDLAATTPVGSPWTLLSGSATTFNITYAGSIYCEPVWTLTIPNSTVAIASFSLSNTTAGETLSITFPGNLPASTAATVTIDSGAMTVTDANGVAYDATGSFPLLYGPAGQVNAMSATLTPASGSATGCKIAASFNPRWMI
jgi:hypothetical protein